uniref:Uncharacterized protein n=1 Tax=Aegilops tauschii TaxID=37682 RepID=M8BEP7_AEGTA
MDPALHAAAVQGSVASLRKLAAERPDILGSKTPQENTALHIAAELGHAGFAEEALHVDHKLLVSKNADGDTPLHLAARSGKVSVVELLIAHSSTTARDGQTGEPSPSTPGSAEAQGALLMANKAGDTPLHQAVQHGWSAVALKLLDAEPSCGHALDAKKQSPLHICRPGGPRGRREQDRQPSLGPRESALLLIKDRRVNPCILNREGQSARSLIEKRGASEEEMDTYEMYLWKKLKKHEACRCQKQQLPPIATYQSLRGRRAGHDEYFKHSVETYTLVATLIATVSFAATFTMPGGYSQTEGTAIHGHTAAFKIFVISNTVAMCSSVVVVFCFIWAWRDPVKFKLDQLMWGHRLTIVACLAMVVSLMTAVYITVAPTARWPAYVVIAIGASTPAMVFLILGKEALYIPL